MLISPKLKVAMKEVEAVLTRHDIGGVVVLTDGEGQSEWRLHVDKPSWSTIRFLEEGGAHLKAYNKTMPVEFGKTTNMLILSRDCVGRVFMMLEEMIKGIESNFTVEKGKGTWTDG